MNNSGDAAEQIVRMSLEGVEVAAKISGKAAKELAVLLMMLFKSGKLKTKGKARLTSMIKSGKPLEIFSVKESDLEKFCEGAKQYGIVYCVLRDRKGAKDGMCDVMVKAEDAPKINRVIQRFKFATVDKAKIESEIVNSKADRAAEPDADAPDAPDINDTEKLLDDLLGTADGKTETEPTAAEKSDADKPEREGTENDPFANRADNPSEPSSESKRSYDGTSSTKPSVREQLREIKAARIEAEAQARGDKTPDKPKHFAEPKHLSEAKHIQPQRGKRTKPKKPKERAL